MRENRTIGGYSLYELIMTLALFATVLTLGIPSFGAILANHRLRTEVDHLVSRRLAGVGCREALKTIPVAGAQP